MGLLHRRKHQNAEDGDVATEKARHDEEEKKSESLGHDLTLRFTDSYSVSCDRAVITGRHYTYSSDTVYLTGLHPTWGAWVSLGPSQDLALIIGRCGSSRLCRVRRRRVRGPPPICQ